MLMAVKFHSSVGESAGLLVSTLLSDASKLTVGASRDAKGALYILFSGDCIIMVGGFVSAGGGLFSLQK